MTQIVKYIAVEYLKKFDKHIIQPSMDYNLSQDLAAIASITGVLSVLNIILIDIVLSGDNAILIGMATKNLPERERNRAIVFGIAMATVLRIGLAIFATVLLRVPGLKFVGGIILFFVVWKFYQDLRTPRATIDETTVESPRTISRGLLSAIGTILIADLSMSLDNILGVAGAANANVVVLGFGLIVSIVLMAFASHIVAKLLIRYPSISWIGMLIILYIACGLVVAGGQTVEEAYARDHIVTATFLILALAFLFLRHYFLSAVSVELGRQHFWETLMSFGVVSISLVVSGLLFTFLPEQSALAYTLLIVAYVAVCEGVLVIVKKSQR